MCCYAGKLLQQAEMNNPTIVVVTDRNDPTANCMPPSAAQDLLKQEPLQANDRDQLREMLNVRESGGIIFTTVQKFAPLDGEQTHLALNLRSNIVVISDEAHRSQYGLSATLNRETGAYKYGYAKHMRDALPNASFMGILPEHRFLPKIKTPARCLVITSLSTIYRMRWKMAQPCLSTMNRAR